MTNDKDGAGVYIPPTDPRLPRAERYAQAISTAAAANERIKALEDALMVSEYRREEAETQLQGLEWDSVLGKVFTQADEEPDSQDFILDLYSGSLWERVEGAVVTDERWKQHTGDRYTTTSGWPIEGGPFIGFPDTWSLKRVLESAERHYDELDRVKHALRDQPGFADPDATSKWSNPRDMGASAKRVVAALLDGVAKARLAGNEKEREATEARKALLDKQTEMVGELETALGSAAMRALADVVKRSEWAESASPHVLVKGAEMQVLQDVDVPEDGGEPIYQAGPLLAAAALLVRAADGLIPQDDAPKATVPEASPDYTPF